jgi:predicted RNA-binding Zn ribbon-like protein
VDAHPIELVLPDEPAPVRLMNTTWADRDGAFEALADASDLRVFLSAIGRPVPAGLGAGEVAVLHDLRGGLRALAGGIEGTDAPSPQQRRAAVERINAALALAPAADVLAVTAQGWSLSRVDGSSFAASVSRLAREGAAVLADRSRPLRVCLAPRCGLFFVRNHQRRRWCSIGCGDRVRAARYYRRHHGGDAW